MTLITRLARLFKADVHGMLDWLEEPEAMLKQAVRDMETEIEQGEHTLAELQRRDQKLKAFEDGLRQTLTELEVHIDVCLEEDNDDLVRAAIRKKLEAEHRLRATVQTAAALTAEQEAQQRKLNEQQEQLSAIVEKMQLFVDSSLHASTQEPYTTFERSTLAVSDTEVEIAFLHTKRQRARSVAEG